MFRQGFHIFIFPHFSVFSAAFVTEETFSQNVASIIFLIVRNKNCYKSVSRTCSIYVFKKPQIYYSQVLCNYCSVNTIQIHLEACIPSLLSWLSAFGDTVGDLLGDILATLAAKYYFHKI